jgi:hypothetical protein
MATLKEIRDQLGDRRLSWDEVMLRLHKMTRLHRKALNVIEATAAMRDCARTALAWFEHIDGDFDRFCCKMMYLGWAVSNEYWEPSQEGADRFAADVRRLREVERLARELVEALPQCDEQCGPAMHEVWLTRHYDDDALFLCDECNRTQMADGRQELSWAAQLRALLAALESK